MDEELRAELRRRVAADQEARHTLDTAAMAAADADNLPWLRQVITDVGWPGKSLVGEDGAQAAWLLAQHADRDPAFQRRCLDLLTAAVERGEATAVQQAYLTDRVLLHEGKPQEYGTQAIAGTAGSRRGSCVTRTTWTSGGPASGSVPWPGTWPGWPSSTHRSRCGCRARPAGRPSKPGRRTGRDPHGDLPRMRPGARLQRGGLSERPSRISGTGSAGTGPCGLCYGYRAADRRC